MPQLLALMDLDVLIPVGEVVCPGDLVVRLPESGVVHVGAGIQQQCDELASVRLGTLERTKAGSVWVASNQKRYWPVQNDTVVGTITQRFPESYAVDINAAFPAVLGALAFEGATRRSRPQLKVGDVVCCRVEVAARDLDPVLTCMDAAGRAASFGPLKNGHLVRVGTLFAKALAAGPPFLRALGAELKFELAVGANGAVWVDAESPADAVAVGLAVRGSEGATREEAQKLAKALLAARRTGIKVGS